MVGGLKTVMEAVSALNVMLLRFGSRIAWVCLAIMVVVILAQVFFRYVLNAALAWPDEGARFLMLWMTGLVAPLAYRHAGFVSIDMLINMLPRRTALGANLVLLLMSAAVLACGIYFGWTHTFGFGGNFDSSSLKLPLDWIGMEVIRVKLRYMHASLLVGLILLQLVNLELILRNLIGYSDPDAITPESSGFEMAGAD